MRGLTAVQTETAVRLLLSAVAGAAVGLERELRDQAAGLRTHMLVCIGACLFTLVSAVGFDRLVGGVPTGVRYDPTRVASNIVTGVGFLGAGAIIRHGLSIRGLTTAASLWVVAAIGTAIGVGMYWATLVAAGLTIASLWGLRAVRGRIRAAAGIGTTELVLRATSEQSLDDALDVVRAQGFRVRDMRLDDTEGGIEAHLRLRGSSAAAPGLASAITRVPGVTGVDLGEP
jgi:putative Mg2+ transporter-C (MgtC) family protein